MSPFNAPPSPIKLFKPQGLFFYGYSHSSQPSFLSLRTPQDQTHPCARLGRAPVTRQLMSGFRAAFDIKSDAVDLEAVTARGMSTRQCS